MVHQHFQLIPTFTVSENVALGNETSRHGVLDLDGTRDRIRDIGTATGCTSIPTPSSASCRSASSSASS